MLKNVRLSLEAPNGTKLILWEGPVRAMLKRWGDLGQKITESLSISEAIEQKKFGQKIDPPKWIGS
jgi:hypothetical protein